MFVQTWQWSLSMEVFLPEFWKSNWNYSIFINLIVIAFYQSFKIPQMLYPHDAWYLCQYSVTKHYYIKVPVENCNLLKSWKYKKAIVQMNNKEQGTMYPHYHSGLDSNVGSRPKISNVFFHGHINFSYLQYRKNEPGEIHRTQNALGIEQSELLDQFWDYNKYMYINLLQYCL